MNRVVFEIAGTPIAWKRVNPGPGHARPYDEQKREKMVIGYHIRQQFGTTPLLKPPLHCEMHFYFPIPKQHLKKKDSIAGTFYPNRPDADNLTKFILDVCQGILYENDASVASLIVKRMYDDGKGLRTWFCFEEV